MTQLVGGAQHLPAFLGQPQDIGPKVRSAAPALQEAPCASGALMHRLPLPLQHQVAGVRVRLPGARPVHEPACQKVSRANAFRNAVRVAPVSSLSDRGPAGSNLARSRTGQGL